MVWIGLVCMLWPGRNLACSSYGLLRTRILNLTKVGQEMTDILAFIRFLVLFGLVWFGLAWFNFLCFEVTNMTKLTIWPNLKAIKLEMYEILQILALLTSIILGYIFFFSYLTFPYLESICDSSQIDWKYNGKLKVSSAILSSNYLQSFSM